MCDMHLLQTGADDDDLSIIDEGRSIMSASERYIDTRSVLKDEAADATFGSVVRAMRCCCSDNL